VTEEVYFCADCLAELSPSYSEEESCPKCGKDICCEKDFLTEVQWVSRMVDGMDLWNAAVRDGLIKDTTAAGGGGEGA
jgi:hypothetical protein